MQKFQQNQLPVKSVYAEYLHFVELNRPLVSEQEAKLKALLHYGPTLAEHDAKGETFIVIPRVGTISSWSSKATDIAHNCGLNEVERIERGLAYYFELSQPLDEKTTEKIDRTFTRQNDGNGGASSARCRDFIPPSRSETI